MEMKSATGNSPIQRHFEDDETRPSHYVVSRWDDKTTWV